MEKISVGVRPEADSDSGLRFSFVCVALAYDRSFLDPQYRARAKTVWEIDVLNLPPYVEFILHYRT